MSIPSNWWLLINLAISCPAYKWSHKENLSCNTHPGNHPWENQWQTEKWGKSVLTCYRYSKDDWKVTSEL